MHICMILNYDSDVLSLFIYILLFNDIDIHFKFISYFRYVPKLYYKYTTIEEYNFFFRF